MSKSIPDCMLCDHSGSSILDISKDLTELSAPLERQACWENERASQAADCEAQVQTRKLQCFPARRC